MRTSALGLFGAGRAPWRDDPTSVQENAGFVNALLSTASELMALGEVGRVTLQGCSGPVQTVGGGSKFANHGGDGGPRGFGLRSGPPGKLTEGVVQ